MRARGASATPELTAAKTKVGLPFASPPPGCAGLFSPSRIFSLLGSNGKSSGKGSGVRRRHTTAPRTGGDAGAAADGAGPHKQLPLEMGMGPPRGAGGERGEVVGTSSAGQGGNHAVADEQEGVAGVSEDEEAAAVAGGTVPTPATGVSHRVVRRLDQHEAWGATTAAARRLSGALPHGDEPTSAATAAASVAAAEAGHRPAPAELPARLPLFASDVSSTAAAAAINSKPVVARASQGPAVLAAAALALSLQGSHSCPATPPSHKQQERTAAIGVAEPGGTPSRLPVSRAATLGGTPNSKQLITTTPQHDALDQGENASQESGASGFVRRTPLSAKRHGSSRLQHVPWASPAAASGIAGGGTGSYATPQQPLQMGPPVAPLRRECLLAAAAAAFDSLASTATAAAGEETAAGKLHPAAQDAHRLAVSERPDPGKLCQRGKEVEQQQQQQQPLRSSGSGSLLQGTSAVDSSHLLSPEDLAKRRVGPMGSPAWAADMVTMLQGLQRTPLKPPMASGSGQGTGDEDPTPCKDISVMGGLVVKDEGVRGAWITPKSTCSSRALRRLQPELDGVNAREVPVGNLQPLQSQQQHAGRLAGPHQRQQHMGWVDVGQGVPQSLGSLHCVEQLTSQPWSSTASWQAEEQQHQERVGKQGFISVQRQQQQSHHHAAEFCFQRLHSGNMVSVIAAAGLEDAAAAGALDSGAAPLQRAGSDKENHEQASAVKPRCTGAPSDVVAAAAAAAAARAAAAASSHRAAAAAAQAAGTPATVQAAGPPSTNADGTSAGAAAAPKTAAAVPAAATGLPGGPGWGGGSARIVAMHIVPVSMQAAAGLVGTAKQGGIVQLSGSHLALQHPAHMLVNNRTSMGQLGGEQYSAASHLRSKLHAMIDGV